MSPTHFYLLLFIIQYSVFPVPFYLAIILPLLSFRVIIGFHYPIDMVGGAITGCLIWLLSKWIIFPAFLVGIIKSVFNFVFFIK